MFESLVLIVDRLISLVRTREENRRKVFQEMIEPLFQETQKAFDDYCRYLDSVRKVVLSESPLSGDQIDEIGTRRIEQASLRTKVRTLSSVYSASSSDGNIRDFFNLIETLFSPPGEEIPETPTNWQLAPETRILQELSLTELELLPEIQNSLEFPTLRKHEFIAGLPGTGKTNMLWILRLLEASRKVETELQPDVYRIFVAKIVVMSQVDAEINWRRLCRRYGELRLKLTMPA